MTPAQNITKHFGGDWHGHYGTFPTPGHSASDRGMSVRDAEDGDVLINTFNGGDPLAVKDECRRLGLIPERSRANDNSAPWRVTGTYEYADADGSILYRTVRKEKEGERKRFVAERPHGSDWLGKLGDCKRVPYRLPQLLAADPSEIVYFAEGERKADKLVSWGLTATAIAFGCKGWRAEYAQYFTGRTVAILPDNDDEGRKFAATVKAAVDGAGGKAVVVELPGLPPKGDIVDWTGSADDLRALTDAAMSTPVGHDELLPGMAGPEDWVGIKAPERRFLIDGWLVRGAAGLLGGQDGVGKSLLAQQMATCAAAGVNFLGLPIERVRSLYITCEDPIEELHRRQESINAALGVAMGSLNGWLRTSSLKGHIGNELATFDQSGQMTPARRYAQVRQTVLMFGAELVFIDNAAHVFPGNENTRHDVAAFLGLLEQLSIEIDGAVVLLAHPNKQHSQGNKQGNEYSGSTGWSAHVRNRLFLDWNAGDDNLPADPDERILRRSKANYAARGEEILFRWHKWAFVTEADLPPNLNAEFAAVARANVENERFLACLDKLTDERRNVSHSKSAGNYAPKVMAAMPMASGMKERQFADAMNRLLHLEEVFAAQPLWKGGDRKSVLGLARKRVVADVRDGAGRLSEKPQNYARARFAETCGTVREAKAENDGNPCGTVRERGSDNTTYVSGAAQEAAAPFFDEDDIDWDVD